MAPTVPEPDAGKLLQPIVQALLAAAAAAPAIPTVAPVVPTVAIGDSGDDWRGRPLLSVPEFLELVPISERSARRALEPGGDLAALAVRIGRRVFVRTESLIELLGATTQGQRRA